MSFCSSGVGQLVERCLACEADSVGAGLNAWCLFLESQPAIRRLPSIGLASEAALQVPERAKALVRHQTPSVRLADVTYGTNETNETYGTDPPMSRISPIEPVAPSCPP